MSAPEVDLVVNCYERTCRDVLAPGTFPEIERQNRFPFARRVALVNNVDDRADAERRGAELIEAGEIDELRFVADHLDAGLAAAELTRADLGEIPYFTDWALAALVLPGADWMVHWDPELRMEQPADWVTPSVELMERDRRVLTANPAWWDPADIARQTGERSGDFALGHGFSDQVFLVRRSEFARPIYRDRTLARLRYPVAHLGDIFEARVDSHMRRVGRLRATYLPAVYLHDVRIGAAYPARTPWQTALYARNRAISIVLPKLPRALRPRTLRLL
jgi:hypothetical protein